MAGRNKAATVRPRRLVVTPAAQTPFVLPLRLPPSPHALDLPTEILSLIVGFISTGDLRNLLPHEIFKHGKRDQLAKCCRSSKVLLGLARARLYEEWNVTFTLNISSAGVLDNDPDYDSERYETLSRAPHLFNLVRSIKISKVERSEDVDTPLNTTILQELLRLMPEVDELEVGLPTLAGDADRLLASLARARLHLRTLTVVNKTGHPVSSQLSTLLCSQPTLKQLDLTDWPRESPASSIVPIQSSDPPTFQLEKLALIASTLEQPELDFLTHHSAATLRHLRLTTTAQDQETTPSFARLGALHSLYLGSLAPIDLSPTSYDLTTLPLRHLDCQAEVIATADTLPCLPATLETLTLHPSLSAAVTLSLLTSPTLPALSHIQCKLRTAILWTPTEQIEVARACRSRGLRLRMPDPNDGAYDEYTDEERKEWRERGETGLSFIHTWSVWSWPGCSLRCADLLISQVQEAAVEDEPWRPEGNDSARERLCESCALVESPVRCLRAGGRADQDSSSA